MTLSKTFKSQATALVGCDFNLDMEGIEYLQAEFLCPFDHDQAVPIEEFIETDGILLFRFFQPIKIDV